MKHFLSFMDGQLALPNHVFSELQNSCDPDQIPLLIQKLLCFYKQNKTDDDPDLCPDTEQGLNMICSTITITSEVHKALWAYNQQIKDDNQLLESA